MNQSRTTWPRSVTKPVAPKRKCSVTLSPVPSTMASSLACSWASDFFNGRCWLVQLFQIPWHFACMSNKQYSHHQTGARLALLANAIQINDSFFDWGRLTGIMNLPIKITRCVIIPRIKQRLVILFNNRSSFQKWRCNHPIQPPSPSQSIHNYLTMIYHEQKTQRTLLFTSTTLYLLLQ